ncbi:hypothetical protein FRAAL3229 [Frankia alni ACN14a]|uniref:Uncharacterized protein n=1 Tax=Frankia alni (strain DSM 45986 / CECT 9034 / ACN14a) TaxID=326424 RepID=Q0RKT2_FRAAA|nr:hypothetical protein FRAAL3229 [Frankia alni ACN14a]
MASGWAPGRVRRGTPWQRAVRPEAVRLAGRPGSGAVGGHDPSPLTYFVLGDPGAFPESGYALWPASAIDFPPPADTWIVAIITLG